MNDPAKNPYTATPAGSADGGVASVGEITIARVSQMGLVITFALVSGVVMMTAVFGFLTFSNPPEDRPLFRFGGDALLFLVLGFGLLLVAAGAALVFRRVILANARRMTGGTEHDNLPQPLEPRSRLPVWAQQQLGNVAKATLIGQALLEGVAVLNAVLLMIDTNLAHLIPIVLAVVGILLQTPTAGRLKMQLESARL